MLQRRSFLKGLIASVGAGTALVRLAFADETRALVVQQPVGLVTPSLFAAAGYGDDGIAYVLQKGKFVPVGYITSIDMSCSVDDATSCRGEVRLVPGLRSGTMCFEGSV